MKKVVISTWTGVLSLNYGSALQTVALQEMVKKLGYSPITINNQYGNKKRKFRLNINCLRFKSSRGKEYWKTKKKFDSFLERKLIYLRSVLIMTMQKKWRRKPIF